MPKADSSLRSAQERSSPPFEVCAWAFAGLAVTAALNVFTVFFMRGFEGFDQEAVLFKPALDFLNGLILYKETFSQYGPVPILLEAAAIKIAGPYLAAVKAEMILIYCLVSLGLFFIWRRFLSPRLAFLAVVIWNLLSYQFVHPPLVWSSSFALFFQTLCILLLLRATENSRRSELFLSGVFSGLAFFSKQNVGAYLFAAAVVCIVWAGWLQSKSRKKTAFDSLFFSLGAAAPAFAILGWFYSDGALSDWRGQNLIWPRAWAKIFGSPSFGAMIGRLFLLGPMDQTPGRTPSFIFALMPLACLGVALASLALRLRGKEQVARLSLVFTCGLCLASWLQYYPVVGIGHVWWASAPMVGVFVFALYSAAERVAAWLSRFRVHKQQLFVAFIAIFFGYDVATRARFGLSGFLAPSLKVSGGGPLLGLRVSPSAYEFDAQVRSALKREIGANPRPAILLYGMSGLYLTYFDRTEYFHPLFDADYAEVIPVLFPDMQERISKFVDARRPYVIADLPERAKRFREKFPEYSEVADFQDLQDGYTFILMKSGDRR